METDAIEVGATVTFYAGEAPGDAGEYLYVGTLEGYGTAPGTPAPYRTARVRLLEGGVWTVPAARIARCAS